jgi:23S rRNA (cytosine1962-C5)-methyltransferase
LQDIAQHGERAVQVADGHHSIEVLALGHAFAYGTANVRRGCNQKRLTRPRRYQLKRTAVQVFDRGHPWLYRGQMSTAAGVFDNGQWLRLVDGENQIYGHGMYEAEGAIAVRLIARGAREPDAAWVAETVEHALSRRHELGARTDAFRAVHGDSDGLPAVVFDVFAGVGVLQTYSRGADALGRLVATRVRRALDLGAVIWKPTRRRRDSYPGAPRVLFGRTPEPVIVHEDGMSFCVDVLGGQKTGAFLDLRGLRRWLAARELGGARVLDLFSYTGALGVAAARAGAAEIWHVDTSRAALDFGAAHHRASAAPGCEHRWIQADIFDWLPRMDRGERFDVIIVDPPLMTSRIADVPQVLAAYRRLYKGVREHLAPGGHLVACCCTSRITYDELRRALDRALGPRLAFTERLPPEPDHPVGFAEADYLKILVYAESASK